MQSSPPLSICIAARNEERTIRHAIASIFQQNYPESIEVLVGVSASTDTTEQVVRDLSAQDSRIRLLLPRAGKAAAWNALFENARYDTLVFMDADVVCAHGCLHALVSTLQQPDVIGVAGNNVKNIPRGLRHAFRRALHFPFEDRVNIGISGRLYALKRPGFRSAIRANGFQSMPEDMICDDLWVMLNLEKRNHVSATNIQWRFCREAVAYFQPADLHDEFKRAVRNFQGYLQIEREYPGLGFSISTAGLTMHAEEKVPAGFTETLRSKIRMIGEMDSISDRLLLTLILVPRKVVLSRLYKKALTEAARTYEKKSHVWEVPSSTKQEWHFIAPEPSQPKAHALKTRR